jgi:hypothetical protein
MSLRRRQLPRLKRLRALRAWLEGARSGFCFVEVACSWSNHVVSGLDDLERDQTSLAMCRRGEEEQPSIGE